MRILILLSFIAAGLISCNSKEPEGPAPLCDKPCISDTLKFSIKDPMEPFLKIIPSNCIADTVIWSHKKMESNRKIHLSTYMGSILNLDNSKVKCYIKDTSYAFLIFNDCLTRRGYWLKLPFARGGSVEKSVSAINSFDPRYKVEDSLVCYKANNTIYVEEVMTGKKAIVEIPSPVLEYDKMYDIIDSVNITRTRLFMNLKDGGKTVPFEKTISLQ